MLFFIGLVVMIICMSLHMIVRRWNDLFIVVIPTLGVVIFAAQLAVCLVVNSPTKEVKTYAMPQRENIEALSLNESTEGSFFLGCGTVNQEAIYYYMQDTENGFKLQSVDADSAYIKELDNNEAPYLQIDTFTDSWIATQPTTLFWYDPLYLLFGAAPGKSFVSGPSEAFRGNTTYTFYVPKGSIKQNYNFDSQNLK